MIESPTATNNDTKHAVEDNIEEATPGTSAAGKRSNKRLGLKEFIITLIIIFIVWAARRFFGH